MNMREHLDRLGELARKLGPWYEVDKIGNGYVYVWTRGNPEDTEEPFGHNVFDIFPGEVYFYDPTHVIPEEAMPVVLEIAGELERWANKEG